MPGRKTNSTNNINRKHLMEVCGSVYAFNLLAGRWKLKIIYLLKERSMRFTQIKEQIPNVTDRMLSLHLKELQQHQLIEKTVFAETPPRVEYKLTQTAISLSAILEQFEYWGNEHREKATVSMLDEPDGL